MSEDLQFEEPQQSGTELSEDRHESGFDAVQAAVNEELAENERRAQQNCPSQAELEAITF
jgi:hypothetical protein